MIETKNRLHPFCSGCPHMKRTTEIDTDNRILTVSCERYNVCACVADRVKYAKEMEENSDA